MHVGYAPDLGSAFVPYVNLASLKVSEYTYKTVPFSETHYKQRKVRLRKLKPL